MSSVGNGSLQPLLSCAQHRQNLVDRVQRASDLLEATHPPAAGRADIGSSARGLVIVLLFAAYENLLTALCRSLLEAAASLRIGAKRLRPGFQVFAIANSLKGVFDAGRSTVFTNHGPQIVAQLRAGKARDIDTSIFPHDGSYMRKSQVLLFCELFGLPHPGATLREVWQRLDVVVTERNGIAHGRLTADEVGRNYTVDEMRALTYLWVIRWTEFLDLVEQSAANRNFYRVSR